MNQNSVASDIHNYDDLIQNSNKVKRISDLGDVIISIFKGKWSVLRLCTQHMAYHCFADSLLDIFVRNGIVWSGP